MPTLGTEFARYKIEVKQGLEPQLVLLPEGGSELRISKERWASRLGITFSTLMANADYYRKISENYRKIYGGMAGIPIDINFGALSVEEGTALGFIKTMDFLRTAETRQALYEYAFRSSSIFAAEIHWRIMQFLFALVVWSAGFLAATMISSHRISAMVTGSIKNISQIIRFVPSVRLKFSRSFPDLWALRLHDMVELSVLYGLTGALLQFLVAHFIQGTNKTIAVTVGVLMWIAMSCLSPIWAALRQHKTTLALPGALAVTVVTLVMTVAVLGVASLPVGMGLILNAATSKMDNTGSTSLAAAQLIVTSAAVSFLMLNRWSRGARWLIAGAILAFVGAAVVGPWDSEITVRMVSAIVVGCGVLLMLAARYLRRRPIAFLIKDILICLAPLYYFVLIALFASFDILTDSDSLLFVVFVVPMILWLALLVATVKVVYAVAIQPATK